MVQHTKLNLNLKFKFIYENKYYKAFNFLFSFIF